MTIAVKLEDLEVLVKKITNRKSVLSTKEAMEVLNVSTNVFRSLYNDENTQLVPSKMKGKWSAKSVDEEHLRIHGFRTLLSSRVPNQELRKAKRVGSRK